MQSRHALLVEVVALAERREPRLPEDLVDPGAADARDGALVAQQRVEVTGLVDQLGELVEWGRRPGLGAERGHGVVLLDLVDRQQLGPGPLLRPELAQAQLATVGDAQQEARALVAQRRPAGEQLQAAGGHQVDEDAEVAQLDDGHLAHAPHAGDLATGEHVERRVERLHGHHAGRERGLDLLALERGVQAPRGDLDLGQLRH